MLFKTNTDRLVYGNVPIEDVADESHTASPEPAASVDGWIDSVLRSASRDPLSFLYYVMLALFPMFCISAWLSWKLSKDIEMREKRRKKGKVNKTD